MVAIKISEGNFDFEEAKRSPAWIAADKMIKEESERDEPPMTLPLWARIFWSSVAVVIAAGTFEILSKII